jgi:mannosyltransferase OCH1-like enzyme
MWHNFGKKEVLFVDFDEGCGLTRSEVDKPFNSYTNLSLKIYNVLKEMYKNNNTYAVGWSKKSKTPQVVHFVIFNNQEAERLKKNLPDWKMFNGDFEIKIWDQDKIIRQFPELKSLAKLEKSSNLRLYIGLKVLDKFGGNYANFDAKPLHSIFELSNKYNFYAALMPVNKGAAQISLSQKLLGASPAHPIIAKTLAEIDLTGNDLIKGDLTKIDAILVEQAYKNIYFYNANGGKNVVLPAIYFEALDPLEEVCGFSIVN